MSGSGWSGAHLLRHPFGPQPKHAYLRQLLRYRTRLKQASAELFGARYDDVHPNVAALLLSAWDGSPFWRTRMASAGLTRRDLGESDALLAIPPVTRKDIQENFASIVHRDTPRSVWDDVYIGTTSGSTGQPLKYLADGFSYLWYWAFVDAVAERLALRVRWRRGRVDAVLLCALGHSPEYGDFIPVFHGVRFRKINVLAPNARSQLERHNPQLITGDPDSLRAIAGWDLRPKLIMSSAFPMPEDTRQNLTHALCVPVVEYYSAAETGMIGVKLPETTGYEVLTPAVHAEILPETEGRLDDRMGEVVITNLRNPWFPLIRYRLGDRARLPAPRTSSDASVARIMGLQGRTRERFATSTDGWFDPNLLVPILSRSGYREFTVIEKAPGRYHVDVLGQPSPNSNTREALKSRLETLFGSAVLVNLSEHERGWRSPGVKPQPFRREN